MIEVIIRAVNTFCQTLFYYLTVNSSRGMTFASFTHLYTPSTYVRAWGHNRHSGYYALVNEQIKQKPWGGEGGNSILAKSKNIIIIIKGW